jgi:hypothetical protein
VYEIGQAVQVKNSFFEKPFVGKITDKFIGVDDWNIKYVVEVAFDVPIKIVCGDKEIIGTM